MPADPKELRGSPVGESWALKWSDRRSSRSENPPLDRLGTSVYRGTRPSGPSILILADGRFSSPGGIEQRFDACQVFSAAEVFTARAPVRMNTQATLPRK